MVGHVAQEWSLARNGIQLTQEFTVLSSVLGQRTLTSRRTCFHITPRGGDGKWSRETEPHEYCAPVVSLYPMDQYVRNQGNANNKQY